MTITPVPHKNRIDALRLRITMHDRMVLTQHAVVFESLDQRASNTLSTSKKHQTTRVAIQTVYCDHF